MDDLGNWLKPTWFLDWESPDVLAFSREATEGANSARERASRLFYAVRDGFRYDPYTASHEAEDYRASAIVKTSSAYCAPKAILLTAAARAEGVPARIGFADVRNHLASPQDFDGTADALLHPFDRDGRRHMEYVNERGSFDDVPFDEMIRALKETYGEDVGLSAVESEPIFEA